MTHVRTREQGDEWMRKPDQFALLNTHPPKAFFLASRFTRFCSFYYYFSKYYIQFKDYIYKYNMTKIFGTLMKVLKCPWDKLLLNLFIGKYLGTNNSYMESKVYIDSTLSLWLELRVGVVFCQFWVKNCWFTTYDYNMQDFINF